MTRRKMPEKNPRVQGMVDSQEFATEDNGMSMTIGNEDYDEREDESLVEREKNGKRNHVTELTF